MRNKVRNTMTQLLFQIHKSIDDLKKAVNPKILPKEYGGKIPLSEMIGKLKLQI